MSIIDDLKNAIDGYETDNCRTEIIDFTITGNGGTVLNTGETFRFRVKVTNDGALDMKNVTIRARGTTYADVKSGWGSGGTWESSATTTVFTLDAGQSATKDFQGKAKTATTGLKDIVTARIQGWDASLDHILVDKTGAGEYEGKLTIEVRPD